MDVIKLRTMTWGSVIDFGKYQGKTVETIYRLEKGYLTWLYYSFQRYTFSDEILDALNIESEYRIVKPGTNRAMLTLLRRHMNATYIEAATDEKDLIKRRSQVAHQRQIVRDKMKARQKVHEAMNHLDWESKGRLQWKNQGH